MKPHHRKIATSAVVAVGALTVLGIAALGFVRAGIYNVGADDPHLPLTYSMLQQLRDASIATRAAKLTVPADLASPARIKQGAGNYAAMCTQCHLSPGMAPTELSKGLYPSPPDLTKEAVDAAQAFWTIKHGIKASGMPAWGGSMPDDYIWNLAAFVQQLPKLDKAGYDALVASSGGHMHGGGETGMGAHADGPPGHHDAGSMAGMAGMAGMHDEPGTHDGATPPASAHPHAPGTAPHVDGPAAPPSGHPHAPGTPAHDDAPAAPTAPPAAATHRDPAGAPPHSH
ncbi:MAG: cytochrome c [Lysobacter sp.]|nr:MAG: cytochrome c [Lysobacter sp.]